MPEKDRPSRRTRIDTLAKQGHFKPKDLPGNDSYDDGMVDDTGTVRPGSTVNEAGGTYMEDTGPLDMRNRDVRKSGEKREGMRVVKDLTAGNDLYAGDDAAAKWLRENDSEARA